MAPVVAAVAIGATVAGKVQQAKAQKKALSAAEQQQQQAKEEQKRLEEKYGLTPDELDRQSRTFALEKQRQTDLERRAGLSGEDLLKEVGPTTRRLMEDIAARQGKTSEQLFIEEGGKPAELLLQEVSKEGPLGPFQGELQLALQEVNKQAARRGVFNGLAEGGIRFENLGRAGVDLAIKAARERVAQRQSLATQLFNIQAANRAEAGKVGESALGESQQARGELAEFLRDIQTLDQQSKGRAANVATGASQIGQQGISSGFQAGQDILGFQAGQGAALASSGLGTLGSLAGGALERPSVSTAPEPSRKRIEDFGTAERDPLIGALELSGGLGLNPLRR